MVWWILCCKGGVDGVVGFDAHRGYLQLPAWDGASVGAILAGWECFATLGAARGTELYSFVLSQCKQWWNGTVDGEVCGVVGVLVMLRHDGKERRFEGR